MSPRTAKYSVLAAAIVAGVGRPDAEPIDPFSSLRPDVSISAEQRARLDEGDTVVRVSPGRDGYLSLTAVIRINADAERFVRWGACVEVLQKGSYVPEIGRFSSPPSVADLEGLVIDRNDLEELESCRPGKCGVKLSASEMARLHRYRTRDELGHAYRELLVERARDYLARGDCGVGSYDDHEPVVPAALFHTLLNRVEFLPRQLGCYGAYLVSFPAVWDGHVTQSFLYWSKETLGLKPIVSITHFSAARFHDPGLPAAVVAAKQVYASHYKNASLTITALVTDGPSAYLVYLNRSHVDAFQGLFGGLVRRLVERRVKSEAPGVLHGLRRRLESGDPPDGTKVAH